MGITHAELLAQLSSVPDKPGVYLWKDAEGKVLYIGKAKALRKRMRQYVSGHDGRVRIPQMMREVASFDYMVTRSESESLILEINLVNQMSPPYNVDLKDDKSYPFIAITMGDTYPAIKFTREKQVEGTRYFGPYTDAKAARSVIDILRRVVPMCRCSCAQWRQIARQMRAGKPFHPSERPCFDSHIGLGCGVCEGKIEVERYRANVSKVAQFLSGRYSLLERELREAMDDAAAQLDFETAARQRNRLEAIDALKERQTVVGDRKLDLDVVGTYREETIAGVYVLVVRGGRVLNSNEFILDKGLDISPDELISGFLTRYYSQTTEIPPRIVLEFAPQEQVLLEEWLTARRREGDVRAAQVRLLVAQRGIKHELLEMAVRNAHHALMRWTARTHYEDERINAALLQLESALALKTPPYRIECYDISTLHGTHSVGSMVAFTAGKKDRKAYRRFKIRADTTEANDVAMMSEVLYRRFSARNIADDRFAKLPDLIVIDGGKPQLEAARQSLRRCGVEIDVVGLAKREEEIWTVWQDAPVVLPDGTPSLYLMKQVRDEAHRFAIEYHRMLRSKAMTASILDEVVGVGPKKRKELIRVFGSFKKLCEASSEEIAQVKGINTSLAEDIHTLLHDQMQTRDGER